MATKIRKVKLKQNQIPTLKGNTVLFVIQLSINHTYYVNIKFFTFVLLIRFIRKTKALKQQRQK